MVIYSQNKRVESSQPKIGASGQKYTPTKSFVCVLGPPWGGVSGSCQVGFTIGGPGVTYSTNWMMYSYPECVWGTEVELLPDVLRGSGTQAVEDVVIPLLRALPADSRLLQQVVRHKTAHNSVLESQEYK